MEEEKWSHLETWSTGLFCGALQPPPTTSQSWRRAGVVTTRVWPGKFFPPSTVPAYRLFFPSPNSQLGIGLEFQSSAGQIENKYFPS